jgi:hypothetical protein
LHHQLKDRYFACLTGFADTARLLILNKNTIQIEDSTCFAPQQDKLLYQKKDCFFIPQDELTLKQYIPTGLPTFTPNTVTIVPDAAIRPLDALFLFKNLTPGINRLTSK